MSFRKVGILIKVHALFFPLKFFATVKTEKHWEKLSASVSPNNELIAESEGC